MIADFDLSSELFEIVPFSQYAPWKHSFAKTAKLWGLVTTAWVGHIKYNRQDEGGILNDCRVILSRV